MKAASRVSENSQAGFTLLEVLIASVILFSVIVTSTLVYRGAVLSSDKAEQALSVSVAAHSIQRIVTDEFRQLKDRPQSFGEGRYGEITYRWRAEETHKGTRAGALDGSAPAREFSLWRIHLTISKGKMTKQFQFSEISW
jgi:prepilin-type N-terminal cleavage/methylation domain-containing protein